MFQVEVSNDGHIFSEIEEGEYLVGAIRRLNDDEIAIDIEYIDDTKSVSEECANENVMFVEENIGNVSLDLDIMNNISEEENFAGEEIEIVTAEEHLNYAKDNSFNEEEKEVSEEDELGTDNNIDVLDNFEPLKKKEKKGEGPYVSKLRKERTSNRAKGKSYVTAKGKVVAERK